MNRINSRMNNQICVSTYCVVSSYGSILQSFALKRVLRELGFKSTILSRRDGNDFTNFSYYRKKISFNNVLVNFYYWLVKKEIFSRFQKNMDFISDRMDLLEYEKNDSLRNEEFATQIFLAGSDQVFNPIQCRPEFFLDFAPIGTKKVAYAASMGALDVPAAKEKEFERLLNNFDYLSFRERDAAEVARKYTNKEIQVHIDPTFLMNANEWRVIEKEYPIQGKYILLYPIYWDRSLNIKLKALHKKTGLPIILIGDNIGVYHQKAIRDAGVDQFLWLIDHAEYVITSSFHGAALAINFNKKTSMVINLKLPSRLNGLAEILDFPIVPIEKIDSSEIDYERVNNNIAHEKERSMAYLKKVLCNE